MGRIDGGGGGGPSYAIMLAPDVMPMINRNTLASGDAGGSGGGGAGGLDGRDGLGGSFRRGSSGRDDVGGVCCATSSTERSSALSEGGYSFAIFDADTNDGFSPSLEGNTFSIGAPGEGATIGGEDGQSGETNF